MKSIEGRLNKMEERIARETGRGKYQMTTWADIIKIVTLHKNGKISDEEFNKYYLTGALVGKLKIIEEREQERKKRQKKKT